MDRQYFIKKMSLIGGVSLMGIPAGLKRFSQSFANSKEASTKVEKGLTTNIIGVRKKDISIINRLIVIDNVCAWPNLTVLNDDTIIATIFNQPSHGRKEGDVECWASIDGKFWKKRGVPAQHELGTNRMNVAAGQANNGDLIVLASGWQLAAAANSKDPPSLVAVLRPWVSLSSDMGKNWKVHKQNFPEAKKGMTEFIPFGDILFGSDSSLRVLAYAQSKSKAINKVSMFRSDDDGHSWKHMSVLSTGTGETAFSRGHNETASFYLGEGQWIAAARRWKAGQALDLFRSNDDGQTWRLNKQLTSSNQHPGHIFPLEDGNLLLTYGNRIPGQYGISAKVSKDEGASWSDEIKLLTDLSNRDMGYPSSVQLPSGEILTAYYAAGVTSHQRYHMGVLFWELNY